MDRRRTWRGQQPPLRPIHDDGLDPESFPGQFASFAEDVVTFLNCLNEFPEFTDEAVNTSMRAFEVDLKVDSLVGWCCSPLIIFSSIGHRVFRSTKVVCIGLHWTIFSTSFRSISVSSSAALYPRLDVGNWGTHWQHHGQSVDVYWNRYRSSLSLVLWNLHCLPGVPTIRFAQQHAAANLLNLSTVATFFSAVTATTLQFSYQLTDGVLEKSVNAFWFSSLVFSIAAAVNSLLGLTWKQAM